MLPVTALSDYLYCPRKVYLRHVLKFIPVAHKPVVQGKIKHDVFDAISKNEENLLLNISPSNLNRMEDMYKQAYSDFLACSISKFEDDIKKAELDKEQVFNGALKKFLDEASFRARAMIKVIKETGLFGRDLLDMLPVKYKSELWLSSKKLRLKGVIDRVEVINDVYVPIELKTGSMPQDGVWPGHRVQLASYILLLDEKFKSNHGFIEYLDHDVRRKIVMNPFLEDEVKDLTDKVFDALESSSIPEICKNFNKCRSCSFRSRCFTNG